MLDQHLFVYPPFAAGFGKIVKAGRYLLRLLAMLTVPMVLWCTKCRQGIGERQ